MPHRTTLKPLVSRWRNLGLAAAALACTHFAALASEPMPRLPPEKEPAAWQRAGIEAALKDPAPMVQFYTLDYCRRKKWVAQLHLPTAQWLKWLALPDWDMRSLAAEAAVQMGEQTPPEVQLELLRMLKDASPNDSAQHWVRRALYKLGGSMIPEAQMEMALFIQHPHPDMDLMMKAYESLGALGSAMTPATQEALLSFIQNPHADDVGKMFARDALAHVGVGMPPQMRKKMLDLLLDAGAPPTLRSFAADTLGRLGAEMPQQMRKTMLDLLLDAATPPMLRSDAAVAMGRLGAEMPPQALEFLLSVLRDPADRDDLRSSAATALALLGPRMPPEVQQALLAAYDETPPENANKATRKSHLLFHQSMADVLERAGPDMPAAFQQRLVADFLKHEHAARNEPPADPFGTSEHEEKQFVDLPALAGVRPQPDSAVIHALLAEFQDPEASGKTQRTIAKQFFQPLAERGALPPEVQRALLTCLQDEKAEEFVRRLAAETLGHLGASTPPAVKQALLARLQAGSKLYRLYYGTLVAMLSLGPQMPPEAAPTLVEILRRNTAQLNAFRAATAPGAYATPAAAKATDIWSSLDFGALELAVPALGNLGGKMTPEAQAALLEVIEYQPGNHQTPWDAAYALAQMGDKMPPQTQQRLLALLHKHALPMENALCLAIYQTLGVSGIHPVSDAQVAALLADTYAGEPDPELRFYLYLWLGRTPAHLQAVRWLGNTQTDPPLGDTPPQDILHLISRLWPLSTGADAAHTALRHAMARRTRQLLTTHLKTRPLDEPARKILSTLATQFATDPAPECASALKQVQAMLAEDVK